MNLKYPRILYFITGSAPTKDEATEAAKLGPNTVFRNVQHVKDEMLEACDGVAGAVHARYADKPNGFQVVEKFVRDLGIGGDSKNVERAFEAIQTELQTTRADLAQAHDAIQKLNNTVGELQGKLAKRAGREAAQTPEPTTPVEQPTTGASEATGNGWGPNA